MFKKVSFFFSHGRLPPSPAETSQLPPDAPQQTTLGTSPATPSSNEGGESVASPAMSPRDSVIDPSFKGATHPTPSTTHHYNRFLAQKGQYEEFKSTLQAHDKSLELFVKNSACVSAALESLCDAVQEKDYAAEALTAIKLCRHGLEKAISEAPNVASPTSSLVMGVEEGLAMFPKVQAAYVKLGDLSLEMDHYRAKVIEVTSAAEAATAAVENEVLEDGAEPSPKLAKAKEKALARKERNTVKLAESTSAVATCNDEFLQLCEDTEVHRASIINEPNNFADLIEKQKALFRALYLSFDKNSVDMGGEVPPPSKDLVRQPSGTLTKIKKGIRRRSISAGVKINNLKKHKGMPRSGTDFELENEAEYLGGETGYLQLKKDVEYLIKTMEKFPSSLEAVFDSLMAVAISATVLANACLDVDLVGEDDDFEGMSAKAKARANLFVDNINEIKARLGSTSKLTSCYLADVENKVIALIRPLISEMELEKRFPGRKQMALDHSHYSQKLVDQNEAKAKLTEEATEEKLEKATENIAKTTAKLNSTKEALKKETAELLEAFEDLEKKREVVLTHHTKLYFELTCSLWKHASDSIVASIDGIDLSAQKKVSTTGPTAPPPAAAPPPADFDDEDDDSGVPTSPTLAPPPTVGEQSRRASSARLSDTEVAQALSEDIEDLKEFGLDSPPVPEIKSRSERKVSGAPPVEVDDDTDTGELSHVKLAKSKFGDGLASDMIKKAENDNAEKLAKGEVGVEEEDAVGGAVDESTEGPEPVDESVYSSPLKDEDEDEDEIEEVEGVEEVKDLEVEVEAEAEVEEVVVEEEVKEKAEKADKAEEGDVSVDVLEAAEGLLAEVGEETPKE